MDEQVRDTAEPEQIDLSEAARRLGPERFGEIADDNVSGLPYFSKKEGTFKVDPLDELGITSFNEQDEYMQSLVRKILDGVDPYETHRKMKSLEKLWDEAAKTPGLAESPEYKSRYAAVERSDQVLVEAYGKPFAEVAAGMDPKEALQELKFAVEYRIFSEVSEQHIFYPDKTWDASDKMSLEDALEDALEDELPGCEVDTDVSWSELWNILDEEGLTDYDMPDVADIPLTCDIHLGDIDAGPCTMTMQEIFVNGERDIDDLDVDEEREVLSSPIVQLAKQQGIPTWKIISAKAYDGSPAGQIKAEIAEATGSDYGYDVAVPATVTAAQYLALTHGSNEDSLAFAPNAGAQVGMFNSYTGCGGTFDIKLARPLELCPAGSGADIEVSRIRLVDLDDKLEHESDWTVQDVNGFVKSVYDTTPAPSAEVAAKWALGDIAKNEMKKWAKMSPKEVFEVYGRLLPAERRANVYGNEVGFGVEPQCSADKGFDLVQVAVYPTERDFDGRSGVTIIRELEKGLSTESGLPSLLMDCEAAAGGAARGIASAMAQERREDALEDLAEVAERNGGASEHGGREGDITGRERAEVGYDPEKR